MGGTSVERVVELRIRQGRAGVRSRDQQDALVPEELVRDPERGARAARPDDRHDRRVGREGGPCGLPAFRGAQLVLGRELDRVLEQRAVLLVERAVQVVQRELERVHLVLTERRVGTADHLRSPEVDRLVRADLDATELDGRTIDVAASPLAPPPSSLAHAAATMESTATRANALNHLRCFMKPPFFPVPRGSSVTITSRPRLANPRGRFPWSYVTVATGDARRSPDRRSSR